jgi:NAD(P)-dependent dehydrogenase (short-subunit alcohol dehydrogenase family)
MSSSRQSVLVTGASQGLGKELARAFARRGARVVMVARREATLAGAVDEIRREGGEAHGLSFDVADKEAAHRVAGAASALVGEIDVLVHNASTLGPLPMPLLLDTPCEDLCEDLERVLAVNLVGPFRLTKAVVGSMALRRQGVVVFVSSDAAVSAYPRWGAYGVSKAALDHLARSFAAEIEGVRFFAVDPGEMDTQMHADAMPDADRSALARPEDVAARIVALVARTHTPPSATRVIASEIVP